MLLCLLIAYVSPDTAENQEARQCLSYFFIRYSTAHPNNKVKLQSVSIMPLPHAQMLTEPGHIFLDIHDSA